MEDYGMKTLRLFLTVLLLGSATTFIAWPYTVQAASPTAAKDPTAVPPPITRKNPTTVTVDLVAKEVIAEIAPGKTAWMWTFNGTVPGPMIRVMEGDTLIINLTNDSGNAEPHNIDFHASMGPGGGAAVTNVLPGETKTLLFKALRAGAFIYHCAGEGAPWEHVSYGMYGLIMVEPKGGLPKVDKEFYVGQSDWYLKVDETLNTEHRLPAGTYTLDEERALAEHPNHFSFNGHTNALTDPALFGEAIRVDIGDRLKPKTVRFFFVTGGPNIGSNWHIIGQIFDRVYTGSPKTPIENEETVYVPPGSAAVFELTAMVPGKFLLVDHALWRVTKGAAGFLHVDPQCTNIATCPWPDDIYSPPAVGTGH
jgi:nitrite reductase (NO-forming)